MTVTRPASIVTFYSYKGGAGRTVALANVAWILASAGKTVLVVDFDLETPGLHGYYRQFLTDRELESTTGVLDLVHGFAEGANANGAGREDLRDLLDTYTDLSAHVVGLNARFPHGGRLDYLGPGQHDDDYPERLTAFNWTEFLGSEEGAEYLLRLRERMRHGEWDYVLVDSRAGVSPVARICTSVLPDVVVCALTMDSASIAGTARVARGLAAPDGRAIRVHALPTHSGSSELPLRQAKSSEARQAFRDLLGLPGQEAEETYWDQVQVPYAPFYAMSGELAVLRERPTDTAGVLPHYVQLAARVSDGAVSTFTAVPENQRRLYERELHLALRGRPETVALLHAPEDQAWAEWLGELFRLLGIEVLGREAAGLGPDARPVADSVLVLLSTHLRGTPEEMLLSRPPSGLDAGGPHVVCVQLDATPMVPGQADRRPLDVVNLAGLNETAAVTAVLGRFGFTGAEDRIASSAGSRHRFPGRLAEVWNVERRDPYFTGRARQLADLRARLSAPVNAPGRVQALLGMSGAGKSAIAREYAHRFASDYDVVWWVTASEPDAARESLARLAREIARKSGRSVGEDWESLRESLRRGDPYDRWLLVIDNAEEPAALREFVPDAGYGHVLITSRNSDWDREAQALRVDVFTREESRALLGGRLTQAGAAELDRLAEALGDLPMALDQTAAWLRNGPVTVRQFVDQLQSDAETRSGEQFAVEYPTAFAAVHDVTAEWLERESPAAARLLDLSAFLSPDGVSFQVIQSPAMRARLAEVDPELRDSMRLREVLTTLAGRALAQVDQATETFKVHRLTQLARRTRMTPEQREECRRQVLGVLAELAPPDIDADDPRQAQVFAELDKHLLVSGALTSDDPQVRRWVANQVRYRFRRNDWKSARDLGERVLADWRERFPEDIPTLRLATQVANAHRALGAYDAALEMDQATLRTQRKVLRPQDPYTLMTLRGYAAELRALGNFRDALAEDQTTYEGFRRAFGDDHPDTLMASANLALSWYFMGSPLRAIAQDTITLEGRRKILTERDPSTWRSCATLGTFHRHAGRLTDSASYLTEAVRQLTALEGKDAPRTLWAVKSLGLTYLADGDLTSALPLLRDVNTKMQAAWGEDHPVTMASLLAVAMVLHLQGDPAEAAAFAREVLAGHQERFGDEHPFTAMCRSNLALFLLESGQHGEAEEARALATDAVTRLNGSLRPDHPFTLVARINRNNAVAATEPSELVAAEDQRIYDNCRIRWGTEHAVTLTAAANLAHAGAPPAGGGDPLAAVAARCAEQFGPDHHLTRRLTADPYRRVGAALEIEEV
ncbi:FxSxx-COOH system tetratricopeptide repeat protein [Streptomyces sp. B6B3]|uniref:FxSxx-COOH system tetratricopeptide repeat protein n=1 Tax=Streptomyces sp. B6B3 TaxID=3153570 RepID=UPI00325E3ECE